MENLKKPDKAIMPPTHLKLAILNTKASATFGLWVIIIPGLFLLFVLLKYYLKIENPFLLSVEDFVMHVDRNSSTWFLQPLLLLALPMLSIIVNVLAITHFSWEPATRIFVISMKVRWINIVVLLLTTVIVTIFSLYLLMENF